MNVKELSAEQRRQRMNIRNFLMVASLEELEREIFLSQRPGVDPKFAAFRIACIQELIDESKQEMVRR